MELNSAAKTYADLYGSFRWNVPARYNMARECCGRWGEERSRFALYYEPTFPARYLLDQH